MLSFLLSSGFCYDDNDDVDDNDDNDDNDDDDDYDDDDNGDDDRDDDEDDDNEDDDDDIRSWVTGEAEARARHKQPLCGPSRLGEQESRRLGDQRNYSTKSLLEGASCHEDPRMERNPMRKCETVIALTEEPQQKKTHFQKSKSKVSLCASRISFFKRSASKCHSEIMPSSNMPHQFPGIRPTNRLRYRSD